MNGRKRCIESISKVKTELFTGKGVSATGEIARSVADVKQVHNDIRVR
jgi:hypothetical protein